MHIINM